MLALFLIIASAFLCAAVVELSGVYFLCFLACLAIFYVYAYWPERL